MDILPIRGVYCVYTLGIGSISNLKHIETVNYNSILCKLFWYNMQVLCKLLLYHFYIIGVYDPLYSAVHPMKYLESDVIAIIFCWNKTRSLLLLFCYSLAVSAVFRQGRTVAREAIKLQLWCFVQTQKTNCVRWL